MKRLCRTPHLEIWACGKVRGGGDFCMPRRLYVGFPLEESVTQNMRPLIIGLVARMKMNGGKRIFLDRVEVARPSSEDRMDLRVLVQEFLAVLEKYGCVNEPPDPEEYDPAHLLDLVPQE
jgi:hypothetical protein